MHSSPEFSALSHAAQSSGYTSHNKSITILLMIMRMKKKARRKMVGVL
jgi:hypothetical protein